MSVYRLTPELHAGWHIGDTGLTPYIGVDYTWLKASSDWVFVGPPADAWDTSFHLDDPVYMFVGLDHYVTDRLYLNFEGRTNFATTAGASRAASAICSTSAQSRPLPHPRPHRSSSPS